MALHPWKRQPKMKIISAGNNWELVSSFFYWIFLCGTYPRILLEILRRALKLNQRTERSKIATTFSKRLRMKIKLRLRRLEWILFSGEFHFAANKTKILAPNPRCTVHCTRCTNGGCSFYEHLYSSSKEPFIFLKRYTVHRLGCSATFWARRSHIERVEQVGMIAVSYSALRGLECMTNPFYFLPPTIECLGVEDGG